MVSVKSMQSSILKCYVKKVVIIYITHSECSSYEPTTQDPYCLITGISLRYTCKVHL